MPEIPVPFPVNGVVEIAPHARQPELTTRHAENVVPFDIKTGRIGQGGPRWGLAAFDTTNHSQVNGNAKVSLLFQGSYANKSYNFTEPATGGPPVLPIGNVDWSKRTAAGKTAYDAALDTIGNSYILDAGGTVTKYNSAGEVTHTIQVPLKDPGHVCRALAVDEFFNVYVGVTSGGDQAKAGVFKFQQKPDINDDGVTVEEASTLRWSYVAGKYVGDLAVADGVMYVAFNDDNVRRTRIQAYRELNAPSPTRLWDSKWAWPCMGLAVNAGFVYVTSPEADGTAGASADRSVDPTDPNISYVTDQGIFDIPNIPDYSKRVWTHLRSTAIDGEEGLDEYEQGDPVLIWTDLSGHDRHAYGDTVYQQDGSLGSGSDSNPINNPPSWAGNVVGGKPSVRFGGGQNITSFQDGLNQGMLSADAMSTVLAYRDQQKGILPSYNDAAFCVFMVVRSIRNDDGQSKSVTGGGGSTKKHSTPQMLLTQQHLTTPASGTGDIYHGIIFNGNIDSSVATWNVAAGSGYVGVFEFESTAAVTNPPESSAYDGGPCVLTWLCDGAKGTLGAGTTASLFRLNGTQLGDRWKVLNEIQGKLGAVIASQPVSATKRPFDVVNELFEGDLLEMVVLHNNGSTAEPIVLGHPYGAYTAGSTAPKNMDDGTTSASTSTITLMEKIEGTLAHRHGIQGKLDANHPYITSAPLPDSTSVNVNLMNATTAMTGKFKAADGQVVWIKAAAGTDFMGYGIAVESSKTSVATTIYTVGNNSANNTGGITIFTDQGDAASATSSVAGYDGAASTYSGGYMRLDTDFYGNCWVPTPKSNAASIQRMLEVFNESGSKLVAWGLDITANYDLNQQSYAVAVSKEEPDYTGSTVAANVLRAEYCILASDSSNLAGTTQQDTVRRIRTIDKSLSAQASASPKTNVLLAVSNGSLEKWTGSAWTAVSGTATISTSSKYQQATLLKDEVFLTDGQNLTAYGLKTNTASVWKATTSGEIPAGVQLLETWRGRIVAVGLDRTNWYMSRQGDARNWNFTPAVVNDAMAVAGHYNYGGNTAGRCPDTINSIVPWNTYQLLFGCVNSLQLLDDDPARGGKFILLSDVTGMAYGRPWCKSPEGILYFLSNRGDLYSLLPGGIPQPLSHYKIPRRLRALDFSSVYVQMAWDDERDGFHVSAMSFGSTTTATQHYFYHRPTDGFWPMNYGTTRQPTAMVVLDGDATAARRILFGCHDGRVRMLSNTALYDIGTTTTDFNGIPSVVVIGPLAPDGVGDVVAFKRFKAILSPSESGCHYQLMAASSAEPPMDSSGSFDLDPSQLVVAQGRLQPGVNPPVLKPGRGSYCWVVLRDNTPSRRWSLASASIHAEPLGFKAHAAG